MKIIRKIFYPRWADHLIKKYADYEREEFEDRNVLERIIFPWLLIEKNPKKILDIGREEYQHFYNKYFFGRTLWTLDRKTRREEFGSKNHIADDVANLKNHFSDNSLDLIIMNGVFGWGLNDPKKIEKTFLAIHEILKPGGLLVFGFNDFPDKPMAIEDIEALKKLKPFFFPPLKVEKFKCVNGEHTYAFYQKI